VKTQGLSRSAIMRRSPNQVSPDRSIEAIEIVDVVLAEDCTHIDLSVREIGGNVVRIRMSLKVMAAGLALLSGKSAFVLETSASESAGKLTAPIGGWRIVQDADAAAPNLECRTDDGRGVAFAIAYDPVTAIPQLQVAVDL